jgi:hypothetical protein
VACATGAPGGGCSALVAGVGAAGLGLLAAAAGCGCGAGGDGVVVGLAGGAV